MDCTACGAFVGPPGFFCSACGAPVHLPGAAGAQMAALASPPRSASARTLVLIVAALVLLQGAKAAVTVLLWSGGAPFAAFMVAVSMFMPVVVGALLAVGLWRQRNWARLGALVGGALLLLSMVPDATRSVRGGGLLLLPLLAIELALLLAGGYLLLRPGAAEEYR